MKLPHTFIKFCLPLLLLIAGLSVQAQYVFSPSTLLEKYQANNSLSYDSIHIANLSADTLQLEWTVISYDSSAGTYLDFCSSGVCFLGFPSTGSFPSIPGGGFGYAGAHFWTGSTNATAMAKIWLYPQGDFASGDTLTFLLHTTHGSVIEEDVKTNHAAVIFPNPANTIINITGVTPSTTAQVYKVSGQLMLTQTLTSNQLDISRLSKGLYVIRLNSSEGNLLRKLVKE